MQQKYRRLKVGSKLVKAVEEAYDGKELYARVQNSLNKKNEEEQ